MSGRAVMRGNGYWREISAVLALKAVGILLLYCLFVAPLLSAEITPAQLATHLAAPDGGVPSTPQAAR
jgi:hypothetical protein